MNKSKVLAAMVLTIFVSNSLVFGQQQWGGAQDSTGSIFRAGNVGIGTQNPIAMLHLKNLRHLPSLFFEDGIANLAVPINQPMLFGHWDGTVFTERLRINPGGRLGIGTQNPVAMLHLKNLGGLPSLFFEGDTANLAVPKNQPMLLGHWDGTVFTERLRINPGGRLGIGTKEEPKAQLEINSEGGNKSTLRVYAYPRPDDPDVAMGVPVTHLTLTAPDDPDDPDVAMGVPVHVSTMTAPDGKPSFPAFEAINLRRDGQAGYFSIINSRNPNIALMAQTVGTGPAGTFTIGNTSSSTSALIAQTLGTGPAGRFLISNTSSSTSALYVRTIGTGYALELSGPENTGTTATLKIITRGAEQNMLLDGNEIDAVERLYLNHNSRGAVVVPVLEITGGSDLAEPFIIEEEAEVKPGMVVAIDPTQPGQLRLARRAYDRTVAGIVSGANGVKPGLTMKQEDSMANGTLPVALSGRVYCWVDAANGAIEPGDLLTTSDLPGYAMKVTDYAKAQGAIIGKAMMALEKGKGLVLVLVSLQ